MIISLILAVLFTGLFGWLDLSFNFKKQLMEREEMAKGVFVGFTEIIAGGGFPFPFLCRGLCPWRFNAVNFIIDILFTTLIIILIILTVRFLLKKKINRPRL